MKSFTELVKEELERARSKFPAHNSDHESYGILLEEVDEVWDEVKVNYGSNKFGAGRRERMIGELVQVAAMAQRWLEDGGYIKEGTA